MTLSVITLSGFHCVKKLVKMKWFIQALYKIRFIDANREGGKVQKIVT